MGEHAGSPLRYRFFLPSPAQTQGNTGDGSLNETQGTVLCVDKKVELSYTYFGDELCQDKQEKRAKQEYTT